MAFGLSNIRLGLSALRSGTSLSAFAVSGIEPAIVFDAATGTYKKDAANTNFAGLFTLARASSATKVDSSGNLVTVSSGAARTDHHRYSGSAWVNKGILLESEARTNLLLNSGTLATQDVTVSAVQYALSFTGTGTVTLSGASTAGPLVGTGTGENNRVSLVFTPTAGTLTLTVSGTVSNAQLEAVTAANPYPSSYIPTAGATVTRAAETLQIDAARMPDYQTPNVIGPELVTNGTFDTDASGWSVVTGGVISSIAGRLRIEATGSSIVIVRQSMSVVPGKVYRFTATVFGTATSPGQANIAFIADSGNLTSTQTVDRIITAGGSSISIDLVAVTDQAGEFCEFDNISVREIDPLAVSIYMRGEASGSSYTLWNWQANASNNILATINASDFTFTQEAGGTVDSVTGGSITSGQHVPFAVASRHLSNAINGAVGGTALTENSTPTALANLSAANFGIGTTFNGTLEEIRVFVGDIGDTGLEELTA